MANHSTIEELYYMVQESCFAAGIDRHYITLPVFLFSLREVMTEWGDLGGQVTSYLTLTGQSDYYEIPGIFDFVRAHIGQYPVTLLDEQTYESMVQNESVGTNEYIAKIDTNNRLYINGMDADTVINIQGRISIDDINEDAVKFAMPEIDERLVKWGVSALIKKDRGKYQAAMIDEEHYNRILGEKLSKAQAKQAPPQVIPIDYFG